MPATPKWVDSAVTTPMVSALAVHRSRYFECQGGSALTVHQSTHFECQLLSATTGDEPFFVFLLSSCFIPCFTVANVTGTTEG